LVIYYSNSTYFLNNTQNQNVLSKGYTAFNLIGGQSYNLQYTFGTANVGTVELFITESYSPYTAFFTDYFNVGQPEIATYSQSFMMPVNSSCLWQFSIPGNVPIFTLADLSLNEANVAPSFYELLSVLYTNPSQQTISIDTSFNGLVSTDGQLFPINVQIPPRSFVFGFYADCRATISCLNNGTCNQNTGKCQCLSHYVGVACEQCAIGYVNYPSCIFDIIEATTTAQVTESFGLSNIQFQSAYFFISMMLFVILN